MEFGLVRRAGLRIRQEIAEKRDRALVIAEPDDRRRVQRAVVAVARFGREQALELFERLLVLVPPQQDRRVVVSGGQVVGFPLEHGFQQELGVVEDLERSADPCEQAHRLDVIAVLEQERPDEVFGGENVAIAEEARRVDDLRRQGLQLGDLCCGLGCRRRIAGHAVQTLEHAPAGRQRPVQAHGFRKRLDRTRRVTQHDVAVAAFLQAATEAWMESLQAVQHLQSVTGLAELAERQGLEVKHVPVFRDPGFEQARGGDRLGEPPFCQQRADLLYTGLDGGRLSGR